MSCSTSLRGDDIIPVRFKTFSVFWKRIAIFAILRQAELPFWDMEVTAAGAGMNEPNWGALSGRSFSTQALTTTTNHSLTAKQAQVLYESTSFFFHQNDMSVLHSWIRQLAELSEAEWFSRMHGANSDRLKQYKTAMTLWGCLPATSKSYPCLKVLAFVFDPYEVLNNGLIKRV
ncbi:hypothetical protein LZ32DRAFT_666665 [Colletotrichum eremochloae]|nr:hypothetical protein LZ32DRAFT_666665 [Colletotrichum eremochloae]